MSLRSESIRELIEATAADSEALRRKYPLAHSPREQRARQRLLDRVAEELERFDFDLLTRDEQIDWILLRNFLGHQQQQLDERTKVGVDLSGCELLLDLESELQDGVPLDLQQLVRGFDVAGRALQGFEFAELDRVATFRGAKSLRAIRDSIDRWASFYHGYDPEFDWWLSQPLEELQLALAEAETRARLALGQREGDDDPIVGAPIGREALLCELRWEGIAVSPEDLISIADREYRWCEVEMLRASMELGFGDHWRAALEVVKDDHEEPGHQPGLIHDLAWESTEFVESRQLVSVPESAKETWRRGMMSAEAQKVNPFFLGGEQILISFPTLSMSASEKRMSQRANNRAFARATVQHELIPGHHLQFYAVDRFRPYRSLFITPFWIEGWTLHWEMLLWELGFARDARERIGMLFWRMHRCVRVQFSLGFHLGQLDPETCIEWLIERVGHEPSTAEGEVRRSLNGDYGPLYQAAYLIGGLQVHQLYRERTATGVSDIEFHDGFLRENMMPIELLAAFWRESPLTRDWKPGNTLLL